jgi:hypothetical protein
MFSLIKPKTTSLNATIVGSAGSSPPACDFYFWEPITFLAAHDVIGILGAYTGHKPGNWNHSGWKISDYRFSVASSLPRRSLMEHAAASHYHLPHYRREGATAGAVLRGPTASYFDTWETMVSMHLKHVWLHRPYHDLRYLHEHIIERKKTRREDTLSVR